MNGRPENVEPRHASRLLIVEDDPAQRLGLIHLMSAEGFEVIGCATAAEALEHVRQEDVGVVIVSLRLPDLSGASLIEKIREMNGRVRVIIHTGYGSLDSAKAAVNLGAFAYVEMLGDPAELIGHVHRAFREQLDRYAADLEAAVAERTASLREQENLLRSVVEGTDDAIFVKDRTGRYLLTNSADARGLGRSVDEVIGLTDKDLFPAELAEQIMQIDQQVIASGKSRVYEQDFDIPGRGQRSYSIVKYPRLDSDGAVVGVIGVARDITERRRAREELRRERDFAEGLIETAQAIVLVLDTQGRIVRFNPYMEEVSGYRLAEVRGKDRFSTFLPQRDRDRVRSVFSKVVHELQTRGNINPIVTKDGREREIEWYSTTLKDVEGNVTGVLAIGQDITDRKRAEEAMRESEARLRQFADTIEDVVWITDWSDRRILFASPAYERIWGRSLQALYNNPRDWAEGIHPDDRQRAWQVFLELEDEGTYDEEYRIVCPDGSVRWVRDRGFPIRDDQGRVYRVAGIAQDITERKQAEEALRKSEEKFHRLFDDASVGIALVDNDGHVMAANEADCKFLGYAQEELIGMHFKEFTHPDDVETDIDLYGSLIKGERDCYQIDKRYVRKDRKVVWGRLGVSLIREDDGTPIYTVIVCEDITERKRAEEALRQSEARYQELFDSVMEGIGLVDENEVVRFCNPAYAKIFEEDSAEELLGRSLLDYVREDQRDALLSQTELRKKNVSSQYELDIVTRKNNRKTILVSVSPRFDGDNNYVGAFGAVMDITDRKRAEEELAKHRHHLEELVEQRSRALAESREKLRRSERLASIGTLAAGIAHEINNPVGGMLLAAQNALMVKRRGDDEKVVTACLQDIVGDAKRCGQIVQNVLRFARDERAKQWPADLNAIIQQALRHTKERVEQHGAAVETNLAEDLSLITLDPVEMEQVFANLIQNAVESGPDGVHVTIRTESTPAGVRAVVQDDGPGIPDKLLSRLFDPFFTTRQNRGGTGLGLSIVYGIVTEHGGTIDVKSQPGLGTTFTIELPHTLPDPALEEDVADSCPKG